MENKNNQIKMHLYDEKEEKLNTISHGVAAVLSFIGLVFMIIRISHAEILVVFSMMIFMLSMLSVYSASTIYYGTKNLLKKRIWQKVDHAMVALIFAGVATPLLLVISSGTVATIMLTLVIFGTALIIGLNLICVQRFKKHCLILHLLVTIFIIIGLIVDGKSVSTMFMRLLYSAFAIIIIGGYFYLNKARKYTHFIWHITNILSTILIFFAFYLYAI